MPREPDLKIRTAILEGTRRLRESGTTTPRLDAELLLGHLLGKNRTALLASPEIEVTSEQLNAFSQLLDQREAGAPVAYLVGQREFMNLTLRVGLGVLAPRPETELMVEWALDHLANRSIASEEVILDVGCGSGAIAFAVASGLDHSDFIIAASDFSPSAIKWAELNRAELGLTHRVHLVAGDLLSWFGGKAALILANLPYLRNDQIEGNWELSAEPDSALDGGTDGLEIIERLLIDSRRVLARNGSIALEIDPSQSGAVSDLILLHLPWLNPQVHRDLAGFDRFVTATPPDSK